MVLRTFLKGLCMGVAEIIPGVSGSTIALILGVYFKFINFLDAITILVKDLFIEIKNLLITRNFSTLIRLKFFRTVLTKHKDNIDWGFGFTLFFGMIVGLLLSSQLIFYILQNYRQYFFAFLFGLILVSILVFLKKLRNLSLLNLFVLFFIAFFVFSLLNTLQTRCFQNVYDINSNISISFAFFLFLAGFIAICVMMLPGVSGSYILLVLGVYDYIITVLKNIINLNIKIEYLIPLFMIIFGILFGFLCFVKIVKYLNNRYPLQINVVLLGIIIGSLRTVYPFYGGISNVSCQTYTIVLPWEYQKSDIFLVLICVLLGALIGFLFSYFGREKTSGKIQ
ncbi:MAG: DUF368 domain-containing protein [Candidatus Dojkabacteria bacterium]|nr:DUF368 domain-containing protein [Candidatus Dojkabacteria bacterium]